MSTEPIRIGIVDDDEIFRSALHFIIERSPGLQVVAEAGDGAAAVSMVGSVRPDVVLMDISMPNLDGLEATRIISSNFPRTKVVVLTMHNDRASAEASFEAGADWFLNKNCGSRKLRSAIRECFSACSSRGVGSVPGERKPSVH